MWKAIPPALIAAFAILPWPARATEAAPATNPTVSIVTGLAADDLLNVRVSASPFAKVSDRLANGATLKNHGCGDFKGYQWCRVEETGGHAVKGWVPGRYLRDVDPGEAAALATTLAGDASEKEAATGGEPDAGGTAEAATPPPEAEARTAAATPDNLADRLDVDDHPIQAGNTAATAEKKAALSAYVRAYAASKGIATDAAAPTGPEDPAGDPADPTGDTATAADAGIPVPTPRPDPAGAPPMQVAVTAAPALDPQTVGQVSETEAASGPGPAKIVNGEVPCARYYGQPMTHCDASIARSGAGAAEVTVKWTDGSTRIIDFRDGKPSGSNGHGDFRYTREAGLNMIRIGKSERFEITDALAFGD